jgi:hypothetical protein
MKTLVKRIIGWTLLVLALLGFFIGFPVFGMGYTLSRAIILFLIVSGISICVNAFIWLIRWLIQ